MRGIAQGEIYTQAMHAFAGASHHASATIYGLSSFCIYIYIYSLQQLLIFWFCAFSGKD